MRRKSKEGRFAERVVHGVDDAGADETVVIWIERKQGALWAVGRAVNPQHRASDEPRRDDYLFEGYELEDALGAANDALEVIRHHRLLELYLAETLGLHVDDVHDEAERLEHVISEELEQRIDKALGFPTHDPHGDPIPDANLEWPPPSGGRRTSARAV